MRRTWKFPSSPLVLNTKTAAQQQAGSSSKHLFSVTHTLQRYGSHHAWEGTKFPPTTTPATGLHPSVQPVTACATPDSGRSLYYFAHGWSLPSRLSPGHHSPAPCHRVDVCPILFFSNNPLLGTPREANAGGRSLTTPKRITGVCFLINKASSGSRAKWGESRR